MCVLLETLRPSLLEGIMWVETEKTAKHWTVLISPNQWTLRINLPTMGRMPKWIELLIRSKSCKIREEQITGVVKSVIIFIARSRNHVISWIHLSNLQAMCMWPHTSFEKELATLGLVRCEDDHKQWQPSRVLNICGYSINYQKYRLYFIKIRAKNGIKAFSR